jgi:hypothetical protein
VKRTVSTIVLAAAVSALNLSLGGAANAASDPAGTGQPSQSCGSPTALSSPNGCNSVAQADSVRVVVVKGSQAVTWYNDYKSKVRAQPITGDGDQAYYDGYASLSVLIGDDYLRIAVSPAGATPSLSDERQVATAVWPKL